MIRLIVALGFIFLLMAASQAGDYHRIANMICSDCHVMHLTREGAEPASDLLKATTTDLCLSCHDGQVGSGDIAPDVMGVAGLGQPGTRAAGAFQAAPGAQTGNGHNLLVSATPPGGVGSMTLTCLSCHEAHGNDNYRNLVSNPGGNVWPPVRAVTQSALTPTSQQYSVANVRYTSSEGGLSAWCGGCHGDFHGAGGSPNLGGSVSGDTNQITVSPWLRHPVRDITMSQSYSNQHIDARNWFSPLASRAPVVSLSGLIPGSAAGSDNQLFCGSCHKAHGSAHRYGLLWDDAQTAALEDGAKLMDTCQQCHYK